jgi:hypothetical protein
VLDLVVSAPRFFARRDLKSNINREILSGFFLGTKAAFGCFLLLFSRCKAGELELALRELAKNFEREVDSGHIALLQWCRPSSELLVSSRSVLAYGIAVDPANSTELRRESFGRGNALWPLGLHFVDVGANWPGCHSAEKKVPGTEFDIPT